MVQILHLDGFIHEADFLFCPFCGEPIRLTTDNKPKKQRDLEEQIAHIFNTIPEENIEIEKKSIYLGGHPVRERIIIDYGAREKDRRAD